MIETSFGFDTACKTYSEVIGNIQRCLLYTSISERNVDLGTLVGPGGKSLLATVVKSDTVLVDFSMTALDYLKSRCV